MKNRWKWITAALLTYVCLSLDLTNHAESTGLHQTVLNLIASFRGFELYRTLLIPGLYILYGRAEKYRDGKGRWSEILLACFFALNMVLGYAFRENGSWGMLLGIRNGQLLKSIIVLAGWFAVFRSGLSVIFFFLDHSEVEDRKAVRPNQEGRKGFRPVLWYLRQLRNHPFLTSFVSLWILYLPHILISYPAMFMGDTWSIIVQAYSELQNTGTDYLSADSVIRAGVYINQHHPVFYTLCLHGFLQFGDAVFHSLNSGVFLFCLVQAALMISAFSYAVSSLGRSGAKAGYLAALVLYVFVQPQVHNLLMLVTKDGSYTACFIFLAGAQFRMMTGNRDRKTILLFCVSAAGMILLRNEGRYVLLCAGVLTAITDRSNRRRILCFTAAAAVFSLGIYHGLYSWLGYTGGSPREALSVPFQQTARIVRDHPGDVTEEEKAAVDRVLNFELLAENYDMNEADPVKALYRQEATGNDLAAFFRTWAGMLIRHPDTCLEASYGNYYLFFYPSDVRMNYYSYGWSDRMCSYINENIAPLEKSFFLPEWNKRFRLISDSIFEAGLFQVPGFSAMMTSAVYSWALLILFGWVMSQKGKRKAGIAAFCVIPLLLMLVQFGGPSNGDYGRYMLPITAFIPFMAGMLLKLRNQKE